MADKKQERVREVSVGMASFTKVWEAISNQLKKQDEHELKIEFLEKQVKRIQAVLGEQLSIKPLVQPKVQIVEAIGKEVSQ